MNTDPSEDSPRRRNTLFDTEIMGGPDKPGHDVIK
jgi:hypothetical protein